VTEADLPLPLDVSRRAFLRASSVVGSGLLVTAC